MITKITLDNICTKGERREIDFSNPRVIIENLKENYDEWCRIPEIIEVVRLMKRIFSISFNINTDFLKRADQSKESMVELEMVLEGNIYKYSTVYYERELVMENLLRNGALIFSRLKDDPDFALDSSYLRDDEYYTLKEIFNLYTIKCFNPGMELINEVTNTIIVDDWTGIGRVDFLNKFKRQFPELYYKEIIDRMIQDFGFGDEYKEIDKTGLCLIHNRFKTEMSVLTAGSGFNWLCIIVPLMVASKKYELPLMSSVPLDCSLHPILGEKLMRWFLKNNPNYPICRLQNIKLNV